MEMRREHSSMTRNLSYFLIGSSIGAGLALLFAPKSGTEMREDISNAANNGLEKTKETYNQIRDTSNAYYSTAKEKAGELYRKAAANIENIADEIKELPNSVENSISEKAKTLSSAVSESNRAMKNS